MKKLFFLTVILMAFFSKADAQYWDYYWNLKAHNKGQIHFSYGYGFPRLDKNLFKFHKDENDFRAVGVGPFYFKTEYGLNRKISVMLSASYIQYNSDWKRMRPDLKWGFDLPFIYGTKLHDASANIRLNYHMFVTKEIDAYIGGGVGYNYFKHTDYTNYGPDDSTFNAQFKVPFPVSYEMTMGLRYYFLTRTAIYIEAGIGKSIVQAGFVFKFRHRKLD